MAISIEYVDKAVPLAWHVVVLLRVLHRVRHEEIAIDIRYAEGGVACRDPGVLEITVGRCGCEKSIGSRGSEHVNRAAAEVGGEQEHSVDVDADHQTLVDGTVGGIGGCRVVDRE